MSPGLFHFLASRLLWPNDNGVNNTAGWLGAYDITNASGTETLLQEKGIQVDILEDQQGIELYARFRREKPDQDLEDWQGLRAF
jgi:hypothetical protein